ncbi:hypothetical protein [Azospirillum sp.]|uniref:hypothetical protein n=1 Tax=Azospirillum sp. TaxID=34012 RepID=UPI003D73572D
MRRVLFAVFLLSAAPAFAAPPTQTPQPQAPQPSEEERQVAAVFEKARGALRQGKGSAVVPLLSQATVQKLETVRVAARNGDQVAIGRLEPGEKFAAMGLRRHLPPADLRRMSLGDVADHAMQQGWLGPNVIARSSLGPVRVRGDRASALLLVDNRPALVPADFVREAGGWRIDLTNVFSYGGQMLRGFAAMSGKTEDAYIVDILDRLPAGGKPSGKLPLAQPSGVEEAPRAARSGAVTREPLPAPGTLPR